MIGLLFCVIGLLIIICVELSCFVFFGVVIWCWLFWDVFLGLMFGVIFKNDVFNFLVNIWFLRGE